MKIRQGFVSNSSSSSLVALGFRKPYEQVSEDEREANIDNYLYDDANGCYIVGEQLTYDSDGCGHLDDKTFTLEGLHTIRMRIAVKHDVDPETVKLYMVTRAC